MLTSGIDVIRLDIGSPDMPPPEAVTQALATSAACYDNHGYTGYKGTSGFRKAVANYYHKRFGVELNPNTEILPLIGSKEGIANLSLAYLDVGDVVLTPDIGYPAYEMSARLAGAEIYFMKVDADSGYLPDISQIPADIRARAKMLWVNYPNNPTGATAELEFYARTVDFCRENDILLASDNPYVDLTFEGYVARSALQVPDSRSGTLEFMSLSKGWNMAGWRLGAAVGSAQAVKTLLHIKSNMDSGHFQPIYDAGIVALETTPRSWIDARNAIYQQRRDRLMAALTSLGLSAQSPKGSLYVWAKVENGSGAAYAEECLQVAYVSITPGAVYGPGGVNYVRFSLGVPDIQFDLALDRMKTWYNNK